MDWQARWIWAQSHSRTPDFYMYARKEVVLNHTSSATVYITCSSEYKLYANGRYVGRGPSPCHPAYQYYDTHDIKRYLRPGVNVIGVICYNYGVGTHSRPEMPGGLLLQADIINGGSKTLLTTDETWKILPAPEWDRNSPQMFWTIGFQEIYDSRKKPVGWNVVGFDDSKWETPEVIGEVGVEPWTSLIPREIPQLREWEVFPDAVHDAGVISSIESPDLDIATRMYREDILPEPGVVKDANYILARNDGFTEVADSNTYLVLDFGKEVVGYPIINISDGGYGIIDIGYSEALDDRGRVCPTRQDILQADRLIVHGGRQEWQTFGRRAFRYMQLTFRDLAHPLHIESVSINRIGYPVVRTSSFECSDDLVNDIWRTGVYTLTVCMQDHFEDCPLREHGQYPGDARVQALMNYYCFFDKDLVAKSLRQFVQSQREDGLFNALWPSSTNHILPDYNLVWIMMLHDYYLYTGDIELVRELYPNMLLLLDNWMKTQESSNGLLTYESKPDLPLLSEWWLFIDHAPLDKHGEVAAYNAFYYQAMRDASKLAAAICENDSAARWHAKAADIFKAFNERFWDDEQSVYVDCNVNDKQSSTISVQTNTLAVVFGLANSERCTHIASLLSSVHENTNIVRSAGPYFNFYVLQALAKLGMTDEALALIRSDWGEMLKRGATTWWETFLWEWDKNGICSASLCHAWSGAPTYFLPAEILGVKPSMPGSEVVIIQPRVGDLEWAKGSLMTASGHVHVEWQFSLGKLRIDIEAPGGFVLALPIEGFTDPVIEEIDLSPETPERKARKTYGWGNVIWRSGEERDPYVDWLTVQGSTPPDHYQRKNRCSLDGRWVWISESASTYVRYDVYEENQE